MNGRVLLHPTDGGEPVDITSGVQVLYDTVIGGMDWGSGFLTVEDALPIVAVARACGFEQWEEAQRYVDAQQHSAEQARFIDGRFRQFAAHRYELQPDGTSTNVKVPHDHVWSSVGQCMWSGCNARQTEQAQP